MQKKLLTANDWMPPIEAAFLGDGEIVSLYDRDACVATVSDVCGNVLEKLLSHDGLRFYGLYSGDLPVGFFAFSEGVLVSFGLAVERRTEDGLAAFWKEIKSTEESFLCYLYSYNQRAIRWLQKMGATPIFHNVTLLQCQ